MERDTLLKAQMHTKRMYLLLTEVRDLSRQLAEALDRNDQVTVRMLISLRSEPVNKLTETKAMLEDLKKGLPLSDAVRLLELLNGASPATEDESILATQVSSNQRLLEQVLALDKGLNLKIARDKSIYQQNRTSAR